jgi:hypothetical protein
MCCIKDRVVGYGILVWLTVKLVSRSKWRPSTPDNTVLGADIEADAVAEVFVEEEEEEEEALGVEVAGTSFGEGVCRLRLGCSSGKDVPLGKRFPLCIAVRTTYSPVVVSAAPRVCNGRGSICL